MLALIVASRAVVPAGAQEPGLLDHTLARHTASVGGALAARIPDLRIEGVIEAAGDTVRFLFAWATPQRFHFSYGSEPRHRQVWSGDSGSSLEDTVPRPLAVQDLFLAPWLFTLTGARRSASVRGESGGRVIVERETTFGRRDRLTIDTATGRIVRAVTPLASGDSVVAEYGEFRVQSGFHLPYRIVARGPFGRWVLRDLQYRIAGGVAADLFVMGGAPPDSNWRAPWLAPADFEIALTDARRGATAAPASLAAAVAHASAALRAGAWEESQDAIAAAAAIDPEAPAVLALRGRQLLFAHRVAAALPVLRRAAAARAPDSTAAGDLAAALYHAGRLREAADWYRRAAGARRAGFARALEAAGDSAYGVRWPARSAVVDLPFVQSDPLPLVAVTLNGRSRTFFIDSGASIVFLFPDVAAELGLSIFPGDMGTYAFGTRVQTDFAVLDSLGLGPVTLTRLPTAVRPFDGLREAFGRPDLAGALPLAVFQRFRATMDFPGRRLSLRPRGTAPADAAGAARVPFLLVGEHYLLVPGRVNGGDPLWLFLDTGFTAGGFLAPSRTLVRAGVAQSAEDVTSSVPLMVQRLEVGSVSGVAVASRSQVFPATLETSTGFRIGGLVSKTFLQPFRVTWDFDRGEIVFER